MKANAPETSYDEAESLRPFEVAIIELFAVTAQNFGFQKSIGQIYGILYATSAPLCLDNVVKKLGISKGSASQGLKVLRHMGVIRSVFVVGERREHFEPEIELKKLFSSLIKNKIRPQLESSQQRVKSIKELWEQDYEHADQNIKARIMKLERWNQKAGIFIPMLKKYTEFNENNFNS